MFVSPKRLSDQDIVDCLSLIEFSYCDAYIQFNDKDLQRNSYGLLRKEAEDRRLGYIPRPLVRPTQETSGILSLAFHSH